MNKIYILLEICEEYGNRIYLAVYSTLAKAEIEAKKRFSERYEHLLSDPILYEDCIPEIYDKYEILEEEI